VSVLNTFCNKNDSIPMQWMGLRPSQVEAMRNDLPEAVFQAMTPGDVKRLQSLMNEETSSWINDARVPPHVRDRRMDELELMLELGYKVELEAMHWLGMEYLTEWVGRMLERHDWPANAAAASPRLLPSQNDSDDDETAGDNESDGDDNLFDII
jgi:hypothetical protein